MKSRLKDGRFKENHGGVLISGSGRLKTLSTWDVTRRSGGRGCRTHMVDLSAARNRT